MILADTQLGVPSLFGTLLVVAVIAVAAPILVNLKPELRIPAVVVEVLLGALVGPGGLGLIHPDEATQVLSFLGLGFLLFVSGLEVDPHRTAPFLKPVGAAYALSVVIATAVAYAIAGVEPIDHPLLVAFALASTSLGVVIPVLHDAGGTEPEFDNLAVASGSFGEFGALVLIAIFFSTRSGSPGLRAVTLGLFALAVLVGGLAIAGALRTFRPLTALGRLRGGSWQLDIRLAITVLVAFAGVAGALGFEGILGAFAAGVIIRIVDHRGMSRDPEFMVKVDAVGFGFLIPVFFIASGMSLDFRSLARSPDHLLLIPLFLAGFLLARGLPALLFWRQIGLRSAVALGLLQATTLTVVVVAVDIGVSLRILDLPAGTALIAAALLTELLFPPFALVMLGKVQDERRAP